MAPKTKMIFYGANFFGFFIGLPESALQIMNND